MSTDTPIYYADLCSPSQLEQVKKLAKGSGEHFERIDVAWYSSGEKSAIITERSGRVHKVPLLKI